jgi:hypothetical protein
MESSSKHPASENIGRKNKAKQNKIHARKRLFIYNPNSNEIFHMGLGERRFPP